MLHLKKLTASIETLACDFRQTTDIPLFIRPMVSEGVMRFKKPGNLLWEYTKPLRQGFALTDGKGFRWEEDRENRVPFTTTKDPLAGFIARQIPAWIIFDRKWIEEEYAVSVDSDSPLSLTLEPKRRDVRAVLTALNITFSPDGVADTVIIREARGGTTTIRFWNVTLNGPMDMRIFK
ncbi:MAG: outer membrane lipoprotein carrier protein LolA [Desulfovibrio sp.]|nr:outer membrane lipoprotein carrier protein LolA [Desulfovibrio sp.]